MNQMASEERISEESSLQNRVLAYVSEHPAVKLSAIERVVEASRIEVAEAIQGLIQQGKLRKEEETGEYYPFL